MSETPPPFDFVDWEENPRPLLLIDEVRRPDSVEKEMIYFAFVSTDTRRAVEWARDGLRAREGVAEQTAKARLKGRGLFGDKSSKEHEWLRQVVYRSLHAAGAISLLGTTSRALTEISATVVGGIRAVPVPGDRRTTPSFVQGRELLPLLNALRAIAQRQLKGVTRVEVLVDRSKQLGLDPVSRGLESGEFEWFEGTLFDDDPHVYRIVSASEDSPFRDLLLLPDTIGYLGAYRTNAFEEVAARLRSGERFWIHEGARELLFAALNGQDSAPRGE